MTETMIGITAFGGLIGTSIGALLYMLGGRSNKWMRRYVGSLVIAATTWTTLAIMGKWTPITLGIYPLIAGGMTLGYGADSILKKVVRRLLYALGVISAGLLLAIILGGNAWWLLILQIGVGLWSIYLGVKNPIQAAAEETLVCMLLTLIYPFYAFV